MAYNPLTDFQAAMQRARGNTQYENYGREFFDPMSGMNFMRGVGGMGQDFSSDWARSGNDSGGGGGMTHAMAGLGQGDIWRAYKPTEESDNVYLNGTPYYMYGQDGNYTGQDVWKDLEPNTAMEQFIPLAMMAAPIAMTMAGVAGAAGAGVGSATASELAGAGLGFGGGGTSLGAGAYGSLGAITPEAMAAAMGMTPEAFTALGAGGLGAAGASGGMLAGTGATAGGSGSWLSNLFGGGGSGGTGGALSSVGSALSGGSGSKILGLGATALGALAGGQGQDASKTETSKMDPRLDPYIYGDLFPRAQGLLGSQAGQAQTAGNQLLTTGTGLLGRTAPGTAENPYLKSIADDMQRRTSELLGQNNLAIQGNSVGMNNLGGSRQGVAQGIAAGKAADSLQGQVASLYGGAYETDQNRLRQDWTIGSGLMNQGLNTPFQPLRNATDVYQPFSGFGTTTSNAQSGGGWQGGVGGAIAGASMGRQMGWW